MAGSLHNYKIYRIIHSFFLYLMIIPIKLYQFLLSPFFVRSCRFHPTCSEYAIQAFKTRGIFSGLYLTIWRLMRCNPWGGHGYDPVPPPGTGSIKHLFLKIFRKFSNFLRKIKHYIWPVDIKRNGNF